MIRVTVIVPCRNEIRRLVRFLETLAAQERGGLDIEFLFADGLSDDGAREMLEVWRNKLGKLTILENKRRTVASAMNLGLQRSRGDIILRMDVRAEYAPDYIRQCVAALLKTNAANVGGPAAAKSTTYMERAISLGSRSRFVRGAARYHDPAREGYVESVPFGCWRRSTLEMLGGFDETLARNPDEELNLRLLSAGGKIWQTPKIRMWRQPQSSVIEVARQSAQYGRWKVYGLLLRRRVASWADLAPGILLGSVLLLAAASLFSSISAVALGALLAGYAVTSLGAAIQSCRQPGDLKRLPVMPVVFAAYQIPYGLGLLLGLYDLATRRAPAVSVDLAN